MEVICPNCKHTVEVPPTSQRLVVRQGAQNFNAANARMCPACRVVFVPPVTEEPEDPAGGVQVGPLVQVSM